VHSHAAGATAFPGVVLVALAAAAIAAYLGAVHSTRRRGRWPVHRTVLWVGGVLIGLGAVAGPVADAGHVDVPAHVLAHLMLGMLSPLLLVLSAPVTLALRSLPAVPARRLARLLNGRVARFLTHPVTAAALNTGGLWFLYTSGAYSRLQVNPLLALAVHVHMLVAGYLFTASMISVDPAPHRRGYLFRGVVLAGTLAAHDILAKYLYAHPPGSVPLRQAEAGSVLMYYGGDAIDLLILTVLCRNWYLATRPKSSFTAAAANDSGR
jgi:putative membrane protein